MPRDQYKFEDCRSCKNHRTRKCLTCDVGENYECDERSELDFSDGQMFKDTRDE